MSASILTAGESHRVSREPTLEDLQSIFFNWIERLEGAIEQGEKSYTKPH
jgi:hypothetical protein